MAKLINRILSPRAPFLILAPQVESKYTHEAPDFYGFTNLDQIELLPDLEPLILEKADNDLDKNLAGHRPHRSHRSHTSRSYISPSSPSTSSPSPSYQTPPGRASLTPQWRATNEWQKNLSILISHEVIVSLKDNSVYKGLY